jgi:tetratricopeptide (TPR) repeat protein
VERATAGAFRAAALLAARERELGMVDEGYLQTARDLRVSLSCAGSLPSCQSVDRILDLIGILPASAAGAITRPSSSDAQLAANQRLFRNRQEWSQALHDEARQDPLAAHVWLWFACGPGNAGAEAALAAVGGLRDLPLIQFARLGCSAQQPATLQALIAGEPRFVEVSFLLGQSLVGTLKLDDAADAFDRAYAWHPRWPAVTLSIANVAMTAEDFERALTFYDRSLELEPRATEGLLGKTRALTYLGRYERAIAVTDQLLTERWNLGEARYWRAFNEVQLGRLGEAWDDIEASAKLLINAAVPKLAGTIAYRRNELDLARGKFDESRARDASDCETGFYLGLVVAEQRNWSRTADVFVDTARCLDDAIRALDLDIESIRRSSVREERKSRSIARREQQIASARRMRATSSFNTAVAYYNLSRGAEARPFAEQVANDDQFGERARDLLSRLK